MGYLKYIKELWKKPKENMGSENWKKWLMQLRREPASLRIDHPTRIDRARTLGYKAKEGIIVVRQRVSKGARKRPRVVKGRRPKRFGQRRFSPRKSDQLISEERAARNYKNCEVLNSYWVGEDGNYKWYEIIFVDRAHPVILADRKLEWVAAPAHKGRVFRGKTSSGQKARGLRKKGKGSVQFRPSKRAGKRAK